jgi:hypothetical protein
MDNGTVWVPDFAKFHHTTFFFILFHTDSKMLCFDSEIRLRRCTVSGNWMQFVGKNTGKVIPVAGRGNPLRCEMSRLPRFPDNWLTDGDKVVRKRFLPPPTMKIPDTNFC